MDDRRFDSLTRSLASGASRRAVLKGMLGLGGAAVGGGVLLDQQADAARRPTPTPKPVTCPGRQTWNGSACVCPGDASYKCGPDCCTGEAGDPPSATHSECCDNACCQGTCYGEELCCPTNPGAGEQPPSHILCDGPNGPVCVEGACCSGSECGDLCQPGYARDRFGNCSACPAGSASIDGSDCVPCEPGSAAPNTGSIACEECGLGRYSDDILSTQCVECNPGSFAGIAGSTSCQACGLGTATDLSGASACSPCAAGTYTDQTGQESCATCACGKACNPATGKCPLVPQGGACSVDSDCASGQCGCGAPAGFPPCFCRIENCLADLSNCTGTIGAAACCEGDCLGNDTDGYLCVGPR